MPSNSPLAEPLTPREMDILALLEQNLTDREIAERLVLSVNSVKWYTRQVYGKLGVANRREAVTKARELALLATAEAPAKKPANNLPRQLSSFIGRGKEIDQVVEMVREYALVTLTGAGGVGKTRLAQVVAGALLDDFVSGVWWVGLAPISDSQQVPQTVVSALGLVVSSGHPPEEVLTAFLQERHLLLILDNCEHLLEGVTRLVMDLLSACPGLKILTTSREPLAVPGEITFRMPSLALPPDEAGVSIEQYAAAQLFLERARSIQPGFGLAEGEGPALARICRRLDGIPLAIELAAARVNVLLLSEIADRLEDGFRVLGSGSRVAIPRHATLHATVAWSYDLLPEGERVLLRRLPLFAGGWMLEQAEAVCAANEVEQEEVLDRLAALVNKSLVIAERLPNTSRATSGMRYRLHEMVRQFARERLGETGEEEALRRRFLDCFLHLVEAAEPELKGPRQMAWLARLDQEQGNLTEALRMAVAHSEVLTALRLSGGLAYYWRLRGRLAEGLRWLEAAIALQGVIPIPDAATGAQAVTGAQADALRARAKALTGLFVINAFPLPRQRSGLDIMRECKQVYRLLGDRRGLAYLYTFLYPFNVEDRVGMITQMRAILPELLAAGDHWTVANVLNGIALGEQDNGNFSDWEVYTEESLTQMRLAEDQISLAILELYAVWIYWNQGHVHKALDAVYEALRVFDEAGLLFAKIEAYDTLAFFEAALGNFATAYNNINEGTRIIGECGAFWLLPRGQLLGRFYFLEGRLVEARAALEQAISSPEDIDTETSWGTGEQQKYLGLTLLYENHSERAAQFLAQSLEIVEREGNHELLHETLRELGRMRLAQGNLPAAHDLLHRSLAEITHNRTLPESPALLDLLAQLAMAEDNAMLAARLLGSSDSLLKRMDMMRYPIYRPEYEHCRASAAITLGEAPFAAAYAEGEGIAVGSTPIEAINAMLEH